MKSTIINKILVASLCAATLASCGFRPDRAEADKNLFGTADNFRPFSVNASVGKIDSSIRSVSMLVYPNPADVADLELNALTTSTGELWEVALNELPYRNKLQTNFLKDQDAFQKAKGLSTILFAMGQMRDNASRDIKQLEDNKAIEDTLLITNEANAGISSVSFEPYPCYLRDEKQCSLTASGPKDIAEYSFSCIEFIGYTYLEELDDAGKALLAQCKSLTSNVVALAQKIQLKTKARDAGRDVVLELLQTAGNLTNNVFVFKAGDKDNTDAESVLTFNQDQTEVKEFRIFAQALSYYSDMTSIQEMSYCDNAVNPCNGKISKPVIYTHARGTKRMKFQITMPDYIVSVDGDLTFEPGVIGYRFVDSEAYYKSVKTGQVRRGVFKLEFDVEQL